MKMKYQFLLLFILKSNQLLVDSGFKYYDSGISTPDRAVDEPTARVPVQEYQPLAEKTASKTGEAESRLQTVGTIQEDKQNDSRDKRHPPKKSEDQGLLNLQKLLSSFARNMSSTTVSNRPGTTESPKDSGIRWITSLDDLQDLIQKVNGSIKDRKGRSVIDLVMEDTGKGPKKVAEFIIPILLEHLKLNTTPSQVDLQGSRSPRRRRSAESPEISREELKGLLNRHILSPNLEILGRRRRSGDPSPEEISAKYVVLPERQTYEEVKNFLSLLHLGAIDQGVENGDVSDLPEISKKRQKRSNPFRFLLGNFFPSKKSTTVAHGDRNGDGDQDRNGDRDESILQVSDEEKDGQTTTSGSSPGPHGDQTGDVSQTTNSNQSKSRSKEKHRQAMTKDGDGDHTGDQSGDHLKGTTPSGFEPDETLAKALLNKISIHGAKISIHGDHITLHKDDDLTLSENEDTNRSSTTGDGIDVHGDGIVIRGDDITSHADHISYRQSPITRQQNSKGGDDITVHGDGISIHGDGISIHGDSISIHGDGISIHGDGDHKAQPGRGGDLVQAKGDVSPKGDKSARVRREVSSIQGDGDHSSQPSGRRSGDDSTHGDYLDRSTREVSSIQGDGDTSQTRRAGDVSGRRNGDVSTHGGSSDGSRREVSPTQGDGDHSFQPERLGDMNRIRSGDSSGGDVSGRRNRDDISSDGDSVRKTILKDVDHYSQPGKVGDMNGRRNGDPHGDGDRSSRALSPRNRNLQRFRNRATGDVGRPETCNTNCCSCHTESGENTKICASNKIMYSASCEYYCARRYYLHHGQSVVSVDCKIPPTSIQLLGPNAFADCEIKTYCCPQDAPKVCGSNKLVYNNRQYFTCVKQYYVVYGGYLEEEECTSEHSMTPPCEDCCPGCPELGTPVCANNRKVYKNLCYFECAFKFIKDNDNRSNFTRVHCNGDGYFPTTPPHLPIPTTPPHPPIPTAPPSPPPFSTHDIIQEYHRFDFRVVGKKNITMNITNKKDEENDVMWH